MLYLCHLHCMVQQKLIEFKKKNGNCKVPSYYEQSPSLQYWVFTKHVLYKKFKEGKKKEACGMIEERIAKNLKELDLFGRFVETMKCAFKYIDTTFVRAICYVSCNCCERGDVSSS